MTYQEDQNILVVFGGRTDFPTKANKYQVILNDIWVLFLENLVWYEALTVTGSIPRERFSHCAATASNTQIVIFGGLNNENFCNSETYCLELDPYQSKRQAQEERRRAGV